MSFKKICIMYLTHTRCFSEMCGYNMNKVCTAHTPTQACVYSFMARSLFTSKASVTKNILIIFKYLCQVSKGK